MMEEARLPNKGIPLLLTNNCDRLFYALENSYVDIPPVISCKSGWSVCTSLSTVFSVKIVTVDRCLPEAGIGVEIGVDVHVGLVNGEFGVFGREVAAPPSFFTGEEEATTVAED